jgi:peroxiredoxin
LRDAYPRFRALGIEVVAITFATPEATRRFCERLAAPFLCLADPERRAYDAFGLERAPSWARIFDPRQAPAFVRAVLAGYLPRKSELSARQLPGTFLVDRTGQIRYEHRNRTPADNAPLEELLRAAEAVSSRA